MDAAVGPPPASTSSRRRCWPTPPARSLTSNNPISPAETSMAAAPSAASTSSLAFAIAASRLSAFLRSEAALSVFPWSAALRTLPSIALQVALEPLHANTLRRAEIAPQALPEGDEGEKLEDGEKAQDPPHAPRTGPHRSGEGGRPVEGPHRPAARLDLRKARGVVAPPSQAQKRSIDHSRRSSDRSGCAAPGPRPAVSPWAPGSAPPSPQPSSRRKRPCTSRSRSMAQNRMARPARIPSPFAMYWSATTTSCPKPFAPMRAANHHHRQAQQYRLVHNSGHDAGRRERQLHPGEHLWSCSHPKA